MMAFVSPQLATDPVIVTSENMPEGRGRLLLLVVAHAGTTMLSHQRVRHCADALALAVAVGNPVAVTALSRELRCRIVERSVSDGVVTVTVRSPWGTASASASSGV